jgi:hypothetical protein
MRKSDWRSRHQFHGAAGDAVKFSAVLSGLLCERPLLENASKLDDTIPILCYLSSAKTPIVSKRHHRLTACVSAVNGDKLTLHTPKSLASLCTKYSELTGPLDSRTETLSRDQAEYWWVSLRSQEALEEFAQEFDGAYIDDVAIRATIDRRSNDKSLCTRPQHAPSRLSIKVWTFLQHLCKLNLFLQHV